MYFVDNPNQVEIRINNDDLQFLKIDDKEVNVVSESMLVGLDVVMQRLDSLKKLCH